MEIYSRLIAHFERILIAIKCTQIYQILLFKYEIADTIIISIVKSKTIIELRT